jgi:tetratricopeptide (TPR) repeat protein
VVLGLALQARPALAADEEEAKIHFDKAEMAYKLGRYNEAIREYEAAYRAMPEAAFLFNIAQSHRQQYRLDKKPFHLQKALTLYKSYLREIPRAQNRDTVQKLIDELKSLLTAVEDETKSSRKRARLVLRGDLATGGKVYLDGQLVGTMPLTRKVEPGVHLVKVTKEGYEPWSTSVNVEGDAKMDLPVMMREKGGGGGGSTTTSTPVYKKWWFWTIIGAVAVAGAGTGIYFATRGDSIPTLEF